jgi:hypothetical protein
MQIVKAEESDQCPEISKANWMWSTTSAGLPRTPRSPAPTMHKALGFGDAGDIIDFTAVRDIGKEAADKIGGDLVSFGHDNALVLVNLTKVGNALANGGISLTAGVSVTLDANGFSYSSQFALLLKNIPIGGNLLTLADELKLSWDEDSTKASMLSLEAAKQVVELLANLPFTTSLQLLLGHHAVGNWDTFEMRNLR